jgi:hypothetical protein
MYVLKVNNGPMCERSPNLVTQAMSRTNEAFRIIAYVEIPDSLTDWKSQPQGDQMSFRKKPPKTHFCKN